MKVILGFGSTEKEFEEQERSFVDSWLKEQAREIFVFDDDTVQKLKSELANRTKDYRELDEKYKTAEDYPNRYGYYYFNVIHDAVDLCVIVRFSHINRRHAMSPDGWALMQTEDVWHFKYDHYHLPS